MTEVHWERTVAPGGREKAEATVARLRERKPDSAGYDPSRSVLELRLEVAEGADFDDVAAMELDQVAPDWREWTYKPSD